LQDTLSSAAAAAQNIVQEGALHPQEQLAYEQQQQQQLVSEQQQQQQQQRLTSNQQQQRLDYEQQQQAWRASQVLELQIQQLSELQQLHEAGLLPGYAADELSGLGLEELDEILVSSPWLYGVREFCNQGYLTRGGGG
jgi:hypothetical protein